MRNLAQTIGLKIVESIFVVTATFMIVCGMIAVVNL